MASSSNSSISMSARTSSLELDENLQPLGASTVTAAVYRHHHHHHNHNIHFHQHVNANQSSVLCASESNTANTTTTIDLSELSKSTKSVAGTDYSTTVDIQSGKKLLQQINQAISTQKPAPIEITKYRRISSPKQQRQQATFSSNPNPNSNQPVHFG